MGVLLVCDAPGCFRTIPASAHMNTPSAPPGWMILGTNMRTLVVACCADHLLRASRGHQAIPLKESAPDEEVSQ